MRRRRASGTPNGGRALSYPRCRRRSRHRRARRSPFVAAFLSLIFPGLGQLYAGARLRALAFATPPILFLALVGGLALRMDRYDLLGFLVQPWALSSIFVFNVIVLGYRVVAVIDAWRVASYANAWLASGSGRLGSPRVRVSALSVAGLLAVLLVMARGARGGRPVRPPGDRLRRMRLRYERDGPMRHDQPGRLCQRRRQRLAERGCIAVTPALPSPAGRPSPSRPSRPGMARSVSTSS